MTEAAQDPAELFDLVDALGRPLGRTKVRGEVHRDGDWHRAVHVWVVNPAEGWVLLQRRAYTKDTWPGRVDVSVGGHLGAGETDLDALREAEEEIGLALGPADVRRLGRVAVERHLPGVIDREVLDVYATQTTLPLEAFRPHPVELAGLLAVALDDALALWSGTRTEAPARCLWEGVVRPVTLRAEELCGPDGGLRARALATLQLWVAGGDPVHWPFP